MSVTLEKPRFPVGGAPAGGRPDVPPVAHGGGDAWPHTNRWIPWILAAFVAMLWLVPFDSIQIFGAGPFDLKLDRILIMVMTVIWLAGVFSGGAARATFHRGPIGMVLLVFLAIAVASVILNIASVARLNEMEPAIKKLALLTSYVTFFFVVASTVKREEIERFLTLFLGLATVSAVGMLYDYFTFSNPFINLTAALVPEQFYANPFVAVGASPDAMFSQYNVVGPTLHALAAATMFAIALSYAVIRLVQTQDARQRLLYGAITLLLLAAVYSTGRKTGSFASIAALSVLFAYRPKEMMRLVPIAIVLFGALALARPTIIEQQLNHVAPGKVSEGASGDARAADYPAVSPDFKAHMLTGRGYGTYDPDKYRILDNQYLGLLLETGILGMAAFALCWLSVAFAAFRRNRSAELAAAAPALAAAGAAVAFGVSALLFDVLAFAQVPYLFMFSAAIAVVSTAPAARREEALPQMRDRLEEPLPPLRDRIEEPLPPLLQQLEREWAITRERESHADEASDRRGRRGSWLPRRRSDHGVPAAGGPHDGERVRTPQPAGSPRRPGGRQLPDRARNGLYIVGALLALAIVFGSSGGQDSQDLPALGKAPSGEDPFGLGEFDRLERDQDGKLKPPRDLATRRVPQSRPTATGAPVLTAPGQDGGQQVVLGEQRENTDSPDGRAEVPQDDRSPRRHDDRGSIDGGERPDDGDGQPDDGDAPDDGVNDEPPVTPPSEPEDCLEGDAEDVLRSIGVEPCNGRMDGLNPEVIRKAALAGELSGHDVDVLEKAFRAEAKENSGGGKLVGGFALLMFGGGALRRRVRA